MARPTRNIVGWRFGRLVVTRPDGKVGRNSASLCLCDCGKEHRVMNFNLLSGSTLSCGCMRDENARARVRENPPRKKHGLSGTPTYRTWISMVKRCSNPKNAAFHFYGAKGIKVCERWSDPEKGFINFLEDMGERPSIRHSIDRIDGSGDYTLENCRWATAAQQSCNTKHRSNNKSGYRGVVAWRDRWKAEIQSELFRLHLGCYETKEEAALAYNIASERLQGSYGHRNTLQFMSQETVASVTDKVDKILRKRTRT